MKIRRLHKLIRIKISAMCSLQWDLSYFKVVDDLLLLILIAYCMSKKSDPFYIVTDYIKWVKLAYKLVRSFDLWSLSFFRSVSELELSDLSRTCITIWNQKLAWPKSLKIKSVDPDSVLVISRRRIYRKSLV